MPVRFRITLLFSLLVFFILGLVCSGVYFFSYQGRINTIKKRLANRAITTAKLLSQREIFDQLLVRKIDSVTTIALKNKSVQAFDKHNKKFYSYSDVPADTLTVTTSMLEQARVTGTNFFLVGDKEVVAYHFTGDGNDMVIVSAGEDAEGRQYLGSLLHILILGFLVGNLLVIVAGYLFSRSLLFPIRKISQNVAEISAQNLTRRINTGSSKDEWYQLSSTLNELLDRLQESFELQQRFIANASHELSTPLTSISSQLEVCMLRERDNAAYLEVIKSIYQDVRHMSKLTQTLLEFAKASGTRSGIEIDLVRMDEVVLKLPSEMAKTDPAYSVKLDFSSLPEEEEKLLVYGNEPLLFSAIKNIVANACKYSPNHTAFVKLLVQEEEVVITIADYGAGIARQELQHIFQPFYRAGGSRQEGGFGLGLSLAERIIKIHKGRIHVQSDTGRQTVFTLLMPAATRLQQL